MKYNLSELEKQLEQYAENSKLIEESYVLLSEEMRQIYSFKIFGDNLLAIPADLLIEGDDEEFEIPFSFLNSLEEIDIFENEFRAEIPDHFFQIGSLYGTAEIVLVDKIKNTVHVFHVSDIADKDWLHYKLENEICTLNTFVNSIRPQTVCCLIHAKDYSKWDRFEIRNKTELKTEIESIKYKDEKTVWDEYLQQVKRSLENGFEINYAPRAIRNLIDDFNI